MSLDTKRAEIRKLEERIFQREEVRLHERTFNIALSSHLSSPLMLISVRDVNKGATKK